MTDLYDFQQDALEELFEQTKIVVSGKYGYKQNHLLLQAPTGAGKTIIAQAFINKILELKDNVCFVWLCDGPDLTAQSKKTMDRSNNIKTFSYDEARLLNELEINSVTFVNWEITKNDRKASKDTESSRSLISLTANAKENGKFVICIIDEAHINANSDQSLEFVNQCAPDLILDMTATPNPKRKPTSPAVVVPIERVQDTGLIKQGIKVNPESDLLDYNDSYRQTNKIANLKEFILHKAALKRNNMELLVKEYSDSENNDKNKPYTPLLLIQLPPKSKENESLKDEVIQYFENEGYTLGEDLQVYLSEHYTDELDSIGNNPEVKILIFKNAISKGWDCPRASIICMLRDPKNKQFTTQTIGRIMRQPYRKHFPSSFDALNYGYIYIEEADNKLLYEYIQEAENETGIGTVSSSVKKDLEDNCEIFRLKKQIWVVEDESYSKELIHIKTKMESVNWLNVLNNHQPISNEVLSDTKATLELFNSEEIELNKKTISNLTDYDIKLIYEKQIKLSNMNMDIIKTIIFDVLMSSYNDEKMVMELIVQNLNDKIRPKYDEFKVEVRSKRKFKEGMEPWAPTKTISSKSDRMRTDIGTKYLYDKCFVSKSNTLEEKMFKLLDSTEAVTYWYKNGDNGEKYFCISYSLNGKRRHFFPDYIFETYDYFYIIETKGVNGTEESIKKADALKRYEEKQNDLTKPLITGFVREANGQLYIYNGNNFEKEHADLSKWDVFTVK